MGIALRVRALNRQGPRAFGTLETTVSAAERRRGATTEVGEMNPAEPGSTSDSSVPRSGSSFELPASATSARLARELVRGALTGFETHVVEIAELLVSELVTNAVAHARSAPVMRIEVTGDVVRVAVQDSAPGPVEVQEVGQEALGGRGLLLVDSLAASWGWTPTGEGKRVWFTL